MWANPIGHSTLDLKNSFFSTDYGLDLGMCSLITVLLVTFVVFIVTQKSVWSNLVDYVVQRNPS